MSVIGDVDTCKKIEADDNKIDDASGCSKVLIYQIHHVDKMLQMSLDGKLDTEELLHTRTKLARQAATLRAAGKEEAAKKPEDKIRAIDDHLADNGHVGQV